MWPRPTPPPAIRTGCRTGRRSTASRPASSGGPVVAARVVSPAFGPTGEIVLFAAAFALVGLLPMHLELGRSACTLGLAEAVLVLCLFRLGPLGVATAAAAGEMIACLAQRQSV